MVLNRTILFFALVLGMLLPTSTARAWDLGESVTPRAKSYRSNYKFGKTTDLITVGGHGTQKSIYPTAQYQRKIFAGFALGALGVYSESKATSQSQVYGGMLTANIYLGKEEFTGVWLQGGGGFYNFSASLDGESELISRTAFLATIGYRGVFERIFRIGIAAGALKMDTPNSKFVDYGVGGTIPILTIDIGFGF